METKDIFIDPFPAATVKFPVPVSGGTPPLAEMFTLAVVPKQLITGVEAVTAIGAVTGWPTVIVTEEEHPLKSLTV